MRVKVGLVTSSGSQPRPDATPLVRCVLPAPRSPQSAMTWPGRRVEASSRPKAKVSSGHFEMIEAMLGATFPFCGRREDSDLRERQPGKRSAPLLLEGSTFPQMQGKEQLEVFAVSERLLDALALVARQRGLPQLPAAATCGSQAW